MMERDADRQIARERESDRQTDRQTVKEGVCVCERERERGNRH